MMGDDLRHDDHLRHDGDLPHDGDLRRALHRLADSAAGPPPLSGAGLRALAGRRGRRTRLAVVPAAAVGALLAGATAYALAGGGHATPQEHSAPAPSVAPVVSGVPQASASPTATGAPNGATAPATAPSSSPVSASPTATASSRATAHPTSSAPTGAAACLAAPQGEILVLLRTLSTPGALLSATPVACVQGQLVPSGPTQNWGLAPGVVAPTTGADQLFAVRRDAAGLVVRLDKVAAGHV
ncbi:hypothetical protein [Streptacidiphilus sp. MAP5-3]|uniref:hypothetical protein n=1 Tax=unclassified Streptacidiphilus TaxID=2643834 RepID=UPI003514FB3E